MLNGKIRTKETRLYERFYFQEAVKFVMAMCILIVQSRGITSMLRTLRRDIVEKPTEMLKMSVPSAVYAIQNNMTYVALSNLDVAVQQVTVSLITP